MKSSTKVGESWKNSATKLFIESPVSHLTKENTNNIFLIYKVDFSYLSWSRLHILIDELDLLNLS